MTYDLRLPRFDLARGQDFLRCALCSYMYGHETKRMEHPPLDCAAVVLRREPTALEAAVLALPTAPRSRTEAEKRAVAAAKKQRQRARQRAEQVAKHRQGVLSEGAALREMFTVAYINKLLAFSNKQEPAVMELERDDATDDGALLDDEPWDEEEVAPVQPPPPSFSTQVGFEQVMAINDLMPQIIAMSRPSGWHATCRDAVRCCHSVSASQPSQHRCPICRWAWCVQSPPCHFDCGHLVCSDCLSTAAQHGAADSGSFKPAVGAWVDPPVSLTDTDDIDETDKVCWARRQLACPICSLNRGEQGGEPLPLHCTVTAWSWFTSPSGEGASHFVGPMPQGHPPRDFTSWAVDAGLPVVEIADLPRGEEWWLLREMVAAAREGLV